MIERLQTTLGSLGLSAVEARLDGLLERAAKDEPSYADFLLEVLAERRMPSGSGIPADAAAVHSRGGQSGITLNSQ